MKTVTAIRHAKSDWGTGLPDIDRPLNKRGRRNAPEMGRRLARAGVQPDLMISSPAVRAHTTALLIAAELDYSEGEVAVEEDLYGAGPSTMYHVLARTPAAVEHVMFFTHNPGITDFVNTVADRWVDNVPTCGVARFEFGVSDWRDIGPGGGHLIELDYPKKIS